MVKWEPALNAHILAVALAVSEVTATKEMAEAALAAWSPDLGEKPTVRAIRDQVRKLAADKKPKAAPATKSGTTRAGTKAKKRALDEDDEAEQGAAQEEDGAGPGDAGEGEEPEPASKKQKRLKAVGAKKLGSKKV